MSLSYQTLKLLGTDIVDQFLAARVFMQLDDKLKRIGHSLSHS